MHNTVSVVVVDLDNALFDWTKTELNAFHTTLDALFTRSLINHDELLADLQDMHQLHGTTDYGLVIPRLASLQKNFPKEDLAKKFESVVKVYPHAKMASLYLFPDVEETLLTLKDHGCLLVGYSESMATEVHFRMRQTGLDRLFDFVYSAEDKTAASGLLPDELHLHMAKHSALRRTTARYVHQNTSKPYASSLSQILDDVAAIPSQVVYVSDRAVNQLLSVKELGVICIRASFTQSQERAEHKQLNQVIQWPRSTVERTRSIDLMETFADHTLAHSFSELLSRFEFTSYVDKTPARMDIVQKTWRSAIDVQMHFNELAMKVRNFALTVLGVFLGGAAFAIREHVKVFDRVPLTAIILALGLWVWGGFYIMDRHWYHKLLKGSVKHAKSIEKRYELTHPEFGLTTAINKESPSKLFNVTLNSSQKLSWFYGIGALMLGLAVVGSLFVSDPPAVKPQPLEIKLLPANGTTAKP